MQIAFIRMCYKQYDEKIVVLQGKTETKIDKNDDIFFERFNISINSN